MAPLLSYTHHMSDNRQYCHVGDTAQRCRLGLFQDSDFAGDWGFKINLGWESCVSLEVEHVFRLVGCARNKTSVSHSSTELEIISLDAGLWMDGLVAIDLWDAVTEVLRSSNSTKTPKTKPSAGSCLRDSERDRTSKPTQQGNRDVDQLSHVDHVTTNAHSSRGESQLYMFEDNEAVTKHDH